METRQALLVIADIGGYTRFMRLHRMSLAHAQENTLRLLEAMIDAEPRLRLVGSRATRRSSTSPLRKPRR